MTLEYRIYGPPGTGKTTWIARKAAEYADAFGPDQVSICSMTRSAVREVAGRDLPVPAENISTLHARCRRSLMAGKPAESMVREFARDHPAYATAECLPPSLIRAAGDKCSSDADISDEILLSGGGITLYEHAQILRQQMVPAGRWSPRVALWFTVWDQWCRSRGVLDFTGWLEACNGTGVLPHQQVVFVDEAQDHTPLQLAVLRSWPTEHLMMIGDDDQNLYEWSGASPSAFLSPRLPPEREKVLEQSYRVPRAVHAIASRWISGVRGRRAKAYAPRDHDGEVVRSDYSLADAAAGMLPDGIGEPGRTSMILATCSYMLRDVIVALKRAGIPFWNPYRRADAHWNPLDRTMSVVRSLMVGDRDWSGDEVERWASLLAEKKAFERGGKKALLKACADAGRGQLPLGTLSEHLNAEAMELAMSQDIALLESMRMTGATGDWPYTIRVVRAFGVEESPRVILGTIHSVKGGEADDVVLFPDLSPAGYAEYASNAHRDRILRLFYVGMTRTRDRLTLCERSSPRAVDW